MGFGHEEMGFGTPVIRLRGLHAQILAAGRLNYRKACSTDTFACLEINQVSALPTDMAGVLVPRKNHISLLAERFAHGLARLGSGDVFTRTAASPALVSGLRRKWTHSGTSRYRAKASRNRALECSSSSTIPNNRSSFASIRSRCSNRITNGSRDST
jgi:hypothetical protein